jgi:hypothetical protein
MSPGEVLPPPVVDKAHSVDPPGVGVRPEHAATSATQASAPSRSDFADGKHQFLLAGNAQA